MNVHELLRTHPVARGHVSDPLVRCIDLCFACAQSCTTCADACLAEPSVAELRKCIRLNLDCAEICATTGSVASRCTSAEESALVQLLDVCARACEICAAECERHAKHHEHCRICADVCRRCQEACRTAMQDLGGASGVVQTN